MPSSSRLGVVLVALYLVLGANAARANNNTPSSGGDSTTVVIAEGKNLLRAEIVNYAKELLGARYRYAGRTPAGFDCSGFTRFVLGHFDVDISTCSRSQINDGTKVLIKDVRPGDLIFFRRKGHISHVAMVYDNTDAGVFIIHATSRGVVIDNLMESKYWRPKAFTARDIITTRDLPIAETLAKRQEEKKMMEEISQQAFYWCYASR